jgi:hypothetical protein
MGSGPSSGGVSSWNDLTDKPFYTESTGVVTLLDETQIPLDSGGMFTMSAEGNVFQEGLTYFVTFDGSDYECVSFERIDNGILGYMIGNLAFLGGENSNEPFLIAGIPSEQMVVIIAPNYAGTTVTIKIMVNSEIVHPLDKKFLPDYTHDDIAPPFVIEIADFVEADTPFPVKSYDTDTFNLLVQAAKQGVLKIKIRLKYKMETDFYTSAPGEITTESKSFEVTPCVFVENTENPSINMSAIIRNSVLHIIMANPAYGGYTAGILKTIAYEH